MHEQIREINERYKDGTSGIEASLHIDELAKACNSIRRKKGTVSAKELSPIRLILYPDAEYDMELILPPVTMALHLQMYERAKEILLAMEMPLNVSDFDGRLNEITSYNDGKDEMEYCFGHISIGQIIVCDCDMTKDFMKLFYERLDNKNPDRPPISFTDDVILSRYILYFYTQEHAYDRSYKQLTKGLKNIKEKCPELLKDMMSDSLLLPIDTEFPEGLYKYSREEAGQLIKVYTKYIKTVIECCCESGADAGKFISSLGTIKVVEDQDFVTYEAEYKAYVKMLISCKDMILDSGGEDSRLKLLITLMSQDAALYIIWTNRHKEYETAIRKAVRNIAAGLGKAVRQIIGGDIAWFLENYGDQMSTFNNYLQILTLLKYSCGYDVSLDLSDKRVSAFFRERFEQIQRDEDRDRQISSAVEALELMEDFRNADDVFCPDKEKEFSKDMEADRKKVRDGLKAIGGTLVKLENEELLEVCLRKKLFPVSQSGLLMRKCRTQAVALLPCLIAYKNQRKTLVHATEQ